MADQLAALSDAMEAPTPELKFMRGSMGLLGSNMAMTKTLANHVRDHFRTAFVKFAPVADLRKLLGDGRPSL
jgi:hypothetical protein